MVGATEETLGPTVRKLLVLGGKRRVDAACGLACAGELEEVARLDRPAGARRRSRAARVIFNRARENLPRLASVAAVHVIAGLKKARVSAQRSRRVQR